MPPQQNPLSSTPKLLHSFTPSHSAIVHAAQPLITTTMEYSEALNDYVEGYQSIFTALEDELLEVEHFFTKPNFSDVIDGVLSSDLHKCVHDATPADDVVNSISNSNPDLCEDYLLDFVNDETSTPEEVDLKSSGEVNPLARIFRFKTKPRARNVKRGKRETFDYLKTFWCKPDKMFTGRFVAVYDDDFDGGVIRKSGDGDIEGRRKRHKVWSMPEVLKLVDGVEKLGAGKWTEIKRLFFSSCHQRSAVDLKDKWRNLLRASCKLPCFKGRGEWAQGNGSPTIPHHILCRVRELSMTHPYPKKQKRKIKI